MINFKAFHDGDELKSLDFGVYQLSATFDRVELQKNHFVTLASFGQHINHHLFPTLDHSLLPQLNEILIDTCKEFDAELKTYPWYELMIGQFKQLTRTQVNRLNDNSKNDENQNLEAKLLKMTPRCYIRMLFDVIFYVVVVNLFLSALFVLFRGIL